jgi:hypothetical protein
MNTNTPYAHRDEDTRKQLLKMDERFGPAKECPMPVAVNILLEQGRRTMELGRIQRLSNSAEKSSSEEK